jgi:hypothetical protein
MTEFAGTARFEVLGTLGRGGMGAVYLAHDRERGTEVAVKVLSSVEGPSLQRFKSEFRSLAALSHPHLVPLYELISDGGRWFFTMDVVHGSDFLSWVRPEGQLDVERLRGALRGLAQGVQALHAAGLLHRDLKPSNVLVRPDGHVILLDFGLAHELGTAHTSESVAGTFLYMAPEQATGETLSAASDWYAVGVMLYEALAGRPPFSGNPFVLTAAKLMQTPPAIHELEPEAPEDLAALAMRLLSADPAQRPDGSAVLASLGAELRAAPRPAPARGDAPFVGREAHLAALAAAFAQVEKGEPVVTLVHGRSGTGKSTLLDRFLAPLEAEGRAVVLRGRCMEQESVPFKGLDALIDRLAMWLRRQPKAEVAALLPRHVDALAHIFPVLERVEAIADAPRPAAARTDPQEFRRRAFGALRELLARIGDRVPVVLVVDDFQWGDVDSASALAGLLAPPDAPRCGLIIAYRSEYEASSRCLVEFRAAMGAGAVPHRPVIAVEALDTASAVALAEALLASAGLPAAHATRIAEEAGGNAFYIAELTRHVTRDRAVEGVPRHARPGGGDGGTMPRLDDILWERVQWLPDDSRRLLEAVAVSGRPTRVRAAYDAAELRGRDHAPVVRLRNGHFVRLSGFGLDDEIETYHDRIRETVLGRIEPSLLGRLHRSFAELLQRTEDADAETVAQHWEAAGDRAAAGPWFARAAGAAARALAFDRAATLFRAALERLPAEQAPPALQVGYADALANAGRGAEAAEAYLAAAARVSDPDEARDLRRKAATQFCVSGRVDEGRALFRTLLAEVGERMPNGRLGHLITLLARRGILRVRGIGFTERRADAVPLAMRRRIDLLWWVSASLSVPEGVATAALQSRGLLLALNAGDPERIARSLAWEAFLTATGGWRSADRSAELLGRASALAERLGSPYAAAMVTLANATVAHLQARHQDARRHALDAEERFASTSQGVWWELQTSRTVAAWASWQTGEYREMQRLATRYYADARERGDLALMTNLGSVILPHLALAAGDVTLAREQAQEALRQWTPRGFHIQHAASVFTLGHADIFEQRGEDAVRRVDEAWPVLRRELQLSNQIVLVMFLDLRARGAIEAAARASGSERTRWLRIAERDATRMAKEQTPWGNAFVAVIRAAAGAITGAPTADRQLEASAAELDRTGFPLRAAICRWYLGERRGGSEGRALRDAAERYFQEQLVLTPERFAPVLVPGFAPR